MNLTSKIREELFKISASRTNDMKEYTEERHYLQFRGIKTMFYGDKQDFSRASYSWMSGNMHVEGEQ